MARFVPILLVLASLVVLGAQDQQRPVFRTGVDTVAIYATILDKYGLLIRDLAEDDFEVRDNGKRQSLSMFFSTFQPITATLLIDTSASMTTQLEDVYLAAEQFLIRLMPGDEARVGSFTSTVRYATDFTGDRDVLLRGMREELGIGNPTALWDAIETARVDTAALGGRRVLVVFTDGSDTTSRIAIREVLERLRTDELMVYIVQFPMARRPDIELSMWQVINTARPQIRSRRYRPDDDLARIARQTGGGHFVLRPEHDVNATFTQVAFELHYQYLLGFTPQTRDGKVHELEVRLVDRDDDEIIRARRHYLAPETAGSGGTVR